MVGGNPDSPISKVHPIMLIGIFIFIAPFLATAVGGKLPGWISGFGVAMILIGVVLTAMKQ